MAKELQSASIAAPGFYGLNTQESSVTLAAGFALQADNCVIDKFGRLGARKGYTYLTDDVGSNLGGAHRFLDINGTEYFGCWNHQNFYIYTGSSSFTPVTYIGSNVINDSNWQAATLNDAAYLFQSNYEPIYFSPVTGQIDDVVNVGHGSVPKANTVLSAYGRLWVANTSTNKTTIWWSDLLNGANFQSGTAGSLDLTSVLVNGNDEIVALGAQNGRLIIFCRNNIIIYGDDSGQTLNPANMALIDVITGVGCTARDSIQNTGQDILFLGDDGLHSLGRVIQEKSQPMRDLSKNVRDELVRTVHQHDKNTIKSVYSADNAFYLLLLPEFERIYCFDMRAPLQDGSSRVTIWDNVTHTNMLSGPDDLYFTGIDGLSKYTGYTDNGETYVMKYYTNYFDFDNATLLKMIKRLSITLIGGSGQDFVLKVGYDYSDSYRSFPVSISTRANSEYGIAEYNEAAEYTLGTLSDTVRAPVGGNGNVIQVGFEATVNGTELSIQKLDIYVKTGRVY